LSRPPASTRSRAAGLPRREIVGIALLCSIAAGAGLYIGNKRTSITALEEQAGRMARARAADRGRDRRGARQDRPGAARRDRDNLSLIVVQAQALGRPPATERVTHAPRHRDLGRRTMGEMHRTLRLLRARGRRARARPPARAGRPRRPAGALARGRPAGGPRDRGRAAPPRQSVDLSAFRIVQEALTNVFKHADRAPTSVTIAYGRRALELTIVDRGGGNGHDPGPAATA